MWKSFILKKNPQFIYVKIDSTTFSRTNTDFDIKQARFQNLALHCDPGEATYLH